MNRVQRAMVRMLGLKGAVPQTDLSAMDSRVTGIGWHTIREPWSGAWQQNMEVDAPSDLLAFSAVYACISLISEDIAKLRLCLKRQDDDDIWSELGPRETSPFQRVLAKPNAFQTRQQFISQWITIKLMGGNTYILKERENGLRAMVRALYALDARLVTPRVTVDGDVWYQIKRDDLSGVRQDVYVPASEIIHDRCITPWHPLAGLSPIYAAATAATQGRRIQANSAAFFQNMSRPSGVLSGDKPIDEPTAKRLKAEFEQNFGGGNMGRILVAGAGLSYAPMMIPAQDAQLIEQLRWTTEDIARVFHVPPHKILAGPALALNNVGALSQEYYNTALQRHMEAIESLLTLGLELPAGLGIEFDTEGLLRMDPLAQADADSKLIGAAIMSPNEARWKRDMKPVAGGDTPYLQVQNSSLAALARRDAQAAAAPAVTPAAAPAVPALPAPPNQPAPAKRLPRAIDIKAHAKVKLYELGSRFAA